jgi:hypothetical protein
VSRLIADGVFSPEDKPQFDADFRNTQRQETYPRPTVAVSRAWDTQQSRRDGFPHELRTALRQVLLALGEPMRDANIETRRASTRSGRA